MRGDFAWAKSNRIELKSVAAPEKVDHQTHSLRSDCSVSYWTGCGWDVEFAIHGPPFPKHSGGPVQWGRLTTVQTAKSCLTFAILKVLQSGSEVSWEETGKKTADNAQR